MKEPIHDTHYFLTNPSFVKWVKDPINNPNIFWDNWLENYPADEAAFKEAITILKHVDFKKAAVSQKRQQLILGQILQGQKSTQNKPTPSFLGTTLFKGLVAAAFIGVVLGLFWFNATTDNTPTSVTTIKNIAVVAPKGQRTHLYLPDSTKVVLNAGSTLSYPSQFMADKREVTLEGEAFFDVYHNPKVSFRVLSGPVATVVHGTQFKVKAQPGADQVAIALAEGAVSVHPISAAATVEPIALVPGEKLTLADSFATAVKSGFDYEQEFGFKEDLLVFKDASVADFVRELSAWYGVEVVLAGNNKADWALNGTFKNESLENVLASLQFSKGISYTIKEKQVTININNNN